MEAIGVLLFLGFVLFLMFHLWLSTPLGPVEKSIHRGGTSTYPPPPKEPEYITIPAEWVVIVPPKEK